MPRVRRKAKRRTATQATEDDVEYLRSGVSIFLSDYLCPSGDWWDIDTGAVRALWNEYREVLTYETAWKRPWAWWHYDSPEKRRCLSGVHPFDDPARADYMKSIGALPWVEGNSRMQADPYKLAFGKPTFRSGYSDEAGRFHHDSEEFEDEVCYLYRLGLFNHDERKQWDTMLGHVKAGTDEGRQFQQMLRRNGIEV